MQFPEARLVVGGTEVTIESRISKGAPPRAYLSAASIAELSAVDDGAELMSLGACAPLSAVEQLCEAAAAARPGGEGEAARAIKSMLRWFASTQIRNVACLGGNLATASPISDMVPVLTACGATLTVASAARGRRVASLREFFTGYRQAAPPPATPWGGSTRSTHRYATTSSSISPSSLTTSSSSSAGRSLCSRTN